MSARIKLNDMIAVFDKNKTLKDAEDLLRNLGLDEVKVKEYAKQIMQLRKDIEDSGMKIMSPEHAFAIYIDINQDGTN